jgi:hypothetical protein
MLIEMVEKELMKNVFAVMKANDDFRNLETCP